jgi:hypothetical protein
MTHKRLLALCLLCLLLPDIALALPDVKVTLKVLDEAGLPVEGATATVNFQAGTEGNSESERTDSGGLATLTGSSTRFIEYGASKEGYYSTWYQKSYTEFTGIKGFRRWQPWNETLTLVLREIKNPVALYIGNNRFGSSVGEPIKLPGLDNEYGYDLIEQDWVVPYGSGTHRDFIFKLSGEVTGRNEYDYTLRLTFSNDGDGIQQFDADPIFGSRLRLPHEAPINGYRSELVQRQARTFDRFTANDFPEDRNYYFRVRTKRDDKGNIESALYGKVYGNIAFSISKSIGMLYYLNPNLNDRNLESDYKKNLFPSKLKYGYTEYPP